MKKTKALKYDQGKPDHSMVSKELMDGLALVRMFGAKKYSRDNWKKGFRFNQSSASISRHLKAFESGQDFDPESGLLHLYHIVADVEHLMWDYLYHPENDDRYKKNKK